MRVIIWSVNPLWFGVVLCASASAFAQPVAQRLASHLRVRDLQADVAFLASDSLQGRATPSPGLDAAAEYIASQMRKSGLEAVGDDGYFQTATYHLVTPNLDGLELTLGSAKAAAGTISIQEAIATDLKNAPVFKVPAADLDSLAPEQVKGKVLFIELGNSGFQGQRRIALAVGKLEPALVVMLRATAPPNNPNPRASMRDVSTPAPKTARNRIDRFGRSPSAASAAPISITLEVPLASSFAPLKMRSPSPVARTPR